MSLQFTKATKERAKLRLAIFGPSGSGKTYTALRMATGLGGKIAVIDTERGSASKYADRFGFDVLELEERDIKMYVHAIGAAGKAGYPVLIIDSLTHAWKELLQEVDKLAKTKYSGNTWSAWSDGTPRQNALVDAILNYPGHVIATMRTKTEWVTETTSNGKTKPVRIGLAPEQGKGIEYEFDLLMEMTIDHFCTVIKDRTGRFQDRIIENPDEKLGAELREWLNDGVKPTTQKPVVQKPRGKPLVPRDENEWTEEADAESIAELQAEADDGKPGTPATAQTAMAEAPADLSSKWPVFCKAVRAVMPYDSLPHISATLWKIKGEAYEIFHTSGPDVGKLVDDPATVWGWLAAYKARDDSDTREGDIDPRDGMPFGAK